jgi:hypothetical protein
MRNILMATTAAFALIVASSAAIYASTLNHPGRCQPANSALEYQQMVASEHPGKDVWVQKVQAPHFLWEGKGEIKCRPGTYAAVLFDKK